MLLFARHTSTTSTHIAYLFAHWALIGYLYHLLL